VLIQVILGDSILGDSISISNTNHSSPYVPRLARYIRRLTDEYTATYVCRLTNECMGLCSSVEAIILGSCTKGYIKVIFHGTEEYKITEECTLFSYSAICLAHKYSCTCVVATDS
jgi:hypothetical protein